MPERTPEIRDESNQHDVDFAPCKAGVPLASERRSGVKGLLHAVLEESIRCFLGSDVRLRTEAQRWIDSGDRRWAFSFVTVCETVGLEPTAVRVALRRMQLHNTSPKTISRQKMRGQ